MLKNLPILSFVVCICVLGAFAPSNAEAREQSAIVRMGDLDLGTQAGARALLRRIEGAAGRVCDSTLAAYYASLRRAYLQCRRESVARAVDRIGAPMLLNAFESRYLQR